MAERKPGPVKPPVIDLVARDASAKPAAPEAGPADKPAESEATKLAEPDAASPLFSIPPDTNWPLLGGAALAGAILGTLLTYLAANLWALPDKTVLPPDLTPKFTNQQSQLDDFETRLSGLEGAAANTQISLDATIAQLDAGLNDVKKSIEDLRASPPVPAVDLSGIETELKTLKTRIDAIAAGASGADVDAISTSLATLESGLTALTSRIDGVDGRLSGLDGTLAGLRTDLDATRKILNDHLSAALPSEVGPQLKLPLILSGLESAFASGKPFALELQSLGTILPDARISDALRAAAPNGLSRPDALLLDFEAALPLMLAAQPGGQGNWTDTTIGWLKGMLALRPAEETDGATPEAIVTRLEAAMQRRDYEAAGALLAQLPAPMRDAAGGVPADIAAHAEAEALIDTLRSEALAATPGTTP